uniref:Uncharacterized protein n=1 Tax=Trichogramma kaykai TaxID=54128 RepID=A0ABD2WS30_9HYME
MWVFSPAGARDKQLYEFLVYVGPNNVVADCLSRNPVVEQINVVTRTAGGLKRVNYKLTRTRIVHQKLKETPKVVEANDDDTIESTEKIKVTAEIPNTNAQSIVAEVGKLQDEAEPDSCGKEKANSAGDPNTGDGSAVDASAGDGSAGDGSAVDDSARNDRALVEENKNIDAQNEDAQDEDTRSTAAVKSYSREDDDAYELAEETKTRAVHPVEVVFKEITSPGIIFHRLGEVKQEENVAVVSVIDLPKRENPRYDNNAEWLNTVTKDPKIAKSLHGRILWKWQRNQLFLIPSTSTEDRERGIEQEDRKIKNSINAENAPMLQSTAPPPVPTRLHLRTNQVDNN